MSITMLKNDPLLLNLLPKNMLLHDGCIVTLCPKFSHQTFQLKFISSDLCTTFDNAAFLLFDPMYTRNSEIVNFATSCDEQTVFHVFDSMNLLPDPLFIEFKDRHNDLPSDIPNAAKKEMLDYDNVTREIVNIVSREFNSNPLRESNLFNNVMILGDRGSGKTYQCLVAAAEIRLRFNVATIYVDCRRMVSYTIPDILQKLTSIFHRAISAHSSLIILDDLDHLLPNVSINNDMMPVNNSNPFEHQNIEKVKILLDHLNFLYESSKNLMDHRVSLMCTCNSEQSIHHELLHSDRFAQKVFITPLSSPVQRIYIFRLMIIQLLKLSSIYLDENYISRKTVGFRPQDIFTVVSRVASSLQFNRLRETVSTLEDNDLIVKYLNENIESYIPIGKKSLKLEASRENLSWRHIGGLLQAKEDLERIILRPVKYKRIYDNSPISLPRGILLFGPSGCGKSCIVPALAEEICFNLLTCRGPEILDKYVGQSEAKVRRLFEQAYALSPSILFFDDFDALAPKRGRDSTGATDRVVNQLLTYLDGVEGRIKEKGHVYIIAASSRPDKVDPALLRPGRLESHIYIGPPETNNEWSDLFTKIARSHPDQGKDIEEWIRSGQFIRDLCELKMDHQAMLTPADIRAAFDDARVHSLISQLPLQSSSSHVSIERNQLISALVKLRDRSRLRRYENLTNICIRNV